MRKPTESRHDVAVLFREPQMLLRQFLLAGRKLLAQAGKQRHAPILKHEIFSVHQRHIKEDPRMSRKRAVNAQAKAIKNHLLSPSILGVQRSGSGQGRR